MYLTFLPLKTKKKKEKRKNINPRGPRLKWMDNTKKRKKKGFSHPQQKWNGSSRSSPRHWPLPVSDLPTTSGDQTPA